MTAEEILWKQDCKGYCQGAVYSDSYYEKDEIISAMQEYARLKCQELLEIVAEKAKIVEDNDKQYSEYYLDLGGSLKVDKSSILHAVDLNSFIS